MEDGESDSANAIYEQVRESFRRLVDSGREKELFDRVDWVSDAAALFIASHIKERDASKAVKVYERLAQSSQPFTALSAQHILREMRTTDG